MGDMEATIKSVMAVSSKVSLKILNLTSLFILNYLGIRPGYGGIGGIGGYGGGECQFKMIIQGYP